MVWTLRVISNLTSAVALMQCPKYSKNVQCDAESDFLNNTHNGNSSHLCPNARCIAILVKNTFVIGTSFKCRADISTAARVRDAIRHKIHIRHIVYSVPYGYPAYICVVNTHPTLPRGKYPGPHDARNLTPSGRFKKMEHQCRIRYV